MIPKANYHTHTKYCDGKNTVAEMTKAAFDKGFTHLGFSGHGYTDFDESYCMSRENIQNYLRDVAAVKAEYAGKMEVYAGVEQDCFSKMCIRDRCRCFKAWDFPWRYRNRMTAD